MKYVIMSIFLLSFLLSIAAAIKCYSGHKKDSDTCQQEVIECPEGERCITVSEDYSYDRKYHSILKGCSGNKTCDEKTYAKGSGEKYIRINTKCCNEDRCNDKFYEMPEDGEPRGYMCPTAYCPNTSEECEATGERQCLTKEDQCAFSSATLVQPDGVEVSYTCRGCMSPQACKTYLGQMIGVTIRQAASFECTPPKPV